MEFLKHNFSGKREEFKNNFQDLAGQELPE